MEKEPRHVIWTPDEEGVSEYSLAVEKDHTTRAGIPAIRWTIGDNYSIGGRVEEELDVGRIISTGPRKHTIIDEDFGIHTEVIKIVEEARGMARITNAPFFTVEIQSYDESSGRDLGKVDFGFGKLPQHDCPERDYIRPLQLPKNQGRYGLLKSKEDKGGLIYELEKSKNRFLPSKEANLSLGMVPGVSQEKYDLRLSNMHLLREDTILATYIFLGIRR